MAKFRKKPVVVEAVQFFPDRTPWPVGVVQDGGCTDPTCCEQNYIIDTLEGYHTVTAGDWIITGVKGERYPCKPDIFEMTYEPAGDPKPGGGE